MTGSFMDYQIPRAADLPSIELIQRPTPSPANPPAGCHFHPRCPQVHERCRGERPDLFEADATRAACWLVRQSQGASA